MDPERWQAIESLVGVALETPVAEREAFLSRACGTDAALRAEVDSLLAAAASDPSFLDTPLVQLASLEADAAEPQPLRAGPWRIVAPLGRGGMAQVYLAQRDDGTFDQRVALKVIRRGLDTDDLLARFRAERRILASLQHRNIARVLDAGALVDGRPYLVMEHVEGEPITTWCTTRGLGLAERLAVFGQVCDAVQHAHERLVIHRDLKPANILVGSDGRPVLLDFGIAKLLDGALGDDAVATEAGVRAMTPQYASPEQLAGEPVTTRSDVYALGLLLYELLTGTRPYALRGKSRDEVARLVRETPPPAPSRVASGPFATQLVGDLDTIVQKALATAPADRYGSAAALKDDLARHLAGLPVLARPDGLAYRARKFVARHRRAVTLAGVALLLLGGFTAFTAVQAARLRRQAVALARQQQRAERVTGFLQALFQASDPFARQGDSLTAQALLDAGTRRIATELVDEPAVRADLLLVMSTAYRGLAAYDRADTLARAALALRRTLPDETAGVGEALRQLGDLASDRADQPAALALYDSALAVQRAALGAEHPAVATTLTSRGLSRMETGDLAGAEADLRAALALQRAVAPAADSGLAITTNNLALALKNQGRYDEAESLYRESLALRTRLYGAEHPYSVTTTMNLARLLRDLGRFEQAEAMLRAATAGDLRNLGPRHPYVLGDRSNLAGVWYDLRRYDESVALLQEVLPLQREVLGGLHPDVASSLMRLGRAEGARGQLAAAEKAHLEARAILAPRFGGRHPLRLGNESDLANLYRLQGRRAEAAALQAMVIDSLDAAVGRTHPMAAAARARLARVRWEEGRFDEAAALLREALAGAEASLPAGHPMTAEIAARLDSVGRGVEVR